MLEIHVTFDPATIVAISAFLAGMARLVWSIRRKK